MASKRRRQRTWNPPGPPGTEPDWTPFEADPWPGDVSDDPSNERLTHEEEMSAIAGEKFARYATAILLSIILLFIVALSVRGIVWLLF